MANYPIEFTNLPDEIYDPLAVKSEVWIETKMPDVDFRDSENYFILYFLLLANPDPGTYFELKFNKFFIRFTWASSGTYSKKIEKTDYGYNVEILLYTIPGVALSLNFLSIWQTFEETPLISEYYQVQAGYLTARNPGPDWAIDLDVANSTPTVSDYDFNIFDISTTIPENLMVGLAVKFGLGDYDSIGRPINTVYSRIQKKDDYAFYHRIDELLLPELKFQLPDVLFNASGPEDLGCFLSSMTGTIRLLAHQVSGTPPVAQKGYSADWRIHVIRSGTSPDKITRYGNGWFKRLVLGARQGVMSYWEPRVAINWNKFIYYCSQYAEGEVGYVRLYAIADYLDEEGVLQTSGTLGLYNRDPEFRLEVIAFNVGEGARNLIETLLTFLYGSSFTQLVSYSCFIARDTVDNIVADLGKFTIVPQTYGSFVIHFENDYGGLCDVWFTGGISSGIEVEKAEYVTLGFRNSYTAHQTSNRATSIGLPYEANSGPVSLSRIKELVEMLYSENVWIQATSGRFIPITIDASKAKIYKDQLNGVHVYSLSIKFDRAYIIKAISNLDEFLP